MATVTDQLITVLQLKGAAEFIHEIAAAATAVGGLAKTELEAAGATKVLEETLETFEPLLKVIEAAIGIVTVAITLGTEEFAKAEDQLFQAAIAFKNLGSSLPFEELVKFAEQLQKTIAVTPEEIVRLGGALRRLGVDGQQLEPTVEALLDFAKATGQSIDEATNTFESALVGRGLALKRFGANFKATGDRMKDVIALSKELERLFAGAATAQGSTPLGQIERLKTEFGELFKEIGRLFSGLSSPAIAKLIETIHSWTEIIREFATSKGIPTTAQQAAAAAGLKGDPEQTKYQKDIEANTKKMAAALDGIIGQAFGGPGTIGKAAGNIRALRAAIRTSA